MNKILLVCEGIKAEPKLFSCVQKAFGLNFEICPIGTNIYVLYKKLKDENFEVDIKEVLIELHPEYRMKLKENFLYTYLVFDFDPHHTEKNDKRSLEEIVKDNISKAKEMADHFIDETDPTIGKLYINYPMVESYKDCNSTFDKNYKDNFIKIDEIKNYKYLVTKKKMCNKRINSYTKDDFINLISMNTYKLNYINNFLWEKLNYSDYLSYSSCSNVLKIENDYVINDKLIAVLNTSLFVPIDYFGNRDGFYDLIIKK